MSRTQSNSVVCHSGEYDIGNGGFLAATSKITSECRDGFILQTFERWCNENCSVCGIPTPFINAIKKLYTNNRHFIKFANRIYIGPMILLGVRQGCPLSMVLFALCLEPLLMLLEKCIGHPLSQEKFQCTWGLCR